MSTSKRLKIWGTLPSDSDCNAIIKNSGFLDYMANMHGEKFKKNDDNNLIIKLGGSKTRNEQVGRAIKNSMNYLTGTAQHFPPVFSIVQEICSNSVEWANTVEKNKNWFLGISYNKKSENKYIEYTLTDIGFGILKTLRKKHYQILTDLLLIRNEDVLERAFDKKYNSQSGEPNRNKGLPLIKDKYEKNLINDLIVVTNDVILDFNSAQRAKKLKNSLPGTFFTWKINIENFNKWKNKHIL
jgi:hypothetical protein